jgi:hypothetical protein
VEEPASEFPANEYVQVKGKNRAALINNIFNTVKGKVMYWFENVEDEKLDNA